MDTRSIRISVWVIGLLGALLIVVGAGFRPNANAQLNLLNPKGQDTHITPPLALMASGNSCSLTLNTAGRGTIAVYANDLDLGIDIAPDQSYVELENNVMRVRYESYVESYEQFSIREFFHKPSNKNHVGTQYLDAGGARGSLQSATLVYDGVDRKTVQLIWNNSANQAGREITHESQSS